MPHRKTTKQCINGVPAKIKEGTCEPAEATKIQDGERAQRDREIKRQGRTNTGWGGEEARDATEGIFLAGCEGKGGREGGSERAREAWGRGATGVASGEGRGVGVREPEAGRGRGRGRGRAWGVILLFRKWHVLPP